MDTTEKQNYFKQALSDFAFDAAAGRAIRHLVDVGYTSSQIMQRLDYPVPEAKVHKAVYRYRTETGILLKNLPEISFQSVLLKRKNDVLTSLYSYLMHKILQNGEENSYLSCPFGLLPPDRVHKILSPLTTREREYILGIAWEPAVVYHRLNLRMLEIGVQLAADSDIFLFYFLKTKEQAAVTPDSDVFRLPSG